MTSTEISSSEFQISTISGESSSELREVLEFLRENFFPNEPCAVALDLCPHGYKIPALEASLAITLKQGKSLKATRRDTKEIVGVVILQEKSLQDTEDEPEPLPADAVIPERRCHGYPRKFQTLARFFADLATNNGRAEEKNPLRALGVSTALDAFIICTCSSVQRRGLGMQLMQASLRSARAQGYPAMMCMALSLFTQKICVKLGFSTLYSICYSTYEQDGELVFGHADMGPHKEGQLLVLRL